MKLDKAQIQYIQEDDYLYRVLHNGEIFTFTTPIMGIPFGVDQEYGKVMCRLEFPEEDKMNTQYTHLHRILEKIEKYVCEKFDVSECELKSVLRKKTGLPDLVDCRMKELKGQVITKVVYENKSDNYLKTVYNIPEKSFGVAKLEWFGLFDYRDHPDTIERKHKIGILLYIRSLTVKE
jgi:hypothetical protein